MEKIYKTLRQIFTIYFVFIWLFGNLMWGVILRSAGVVLGVSWIEVEQVLRVYSWSPTVKEIHRVKTINGNADPDFEKNFKW